MDEFEYRLWHSVGKNMGISDNIPRNADGLTEGQVEEARATYNSTTLDDGDQPEGLLRAFPATFSKQKPVADRWELDEWRIPKPGEAFIDNEGIMIDPCLAPQETANYQCWILRKMDE